MSTGTTEQAFQTLRVYKAVEIAAPIDIAFDAVIAEMSTESQMPGGKPFPMVIEPRPGGRWYRDLGEGAGHLWGHVQVIKPPTLIEICGPLFMSFAASNHLQYRLSEEGRITRLKLTHTAAGLIPREHMEGVNEGWQYTLDRIVEIAAAKARR